MDQSIEYDRTATKQPSRRSPWVEALRQGSGSIGRASISGLLIIIAAAGLIGLAINFRVKAITDRALQYDIELEDRGDDFRVAVLDMRHDHRNITFAGPSRRGLADFEAAYLQLHAQIDQLEQLQIDDVQMIDTDALRQTAIRYYTEFRPAIDTYDRDRQTFILASDEGLLRLAELEGVARQVDELGEERAANALRSVESAANAAQIVMLVVLGGLILVGLGLAYLAARNLREQQNAAAELARALELRTVFIADASHELRTPLTVLRANAELAAVGITDAQEHAELLDEILHESERMSRLVDDLLFLASSDSDSSLLQREAVEVAPFLSEVAARAETVAGKYGAVIQPELHAAGLVTLDETRIEQAILILVDNAAKFGPTGGSIVLRSLNRDGELIIEVIDHGPGIAPNELPFVFERFYQVDKARSRAKGGAGLGLAIAKSITEGHGGRIEAESRLDAGTTMRLYLPS